MVKMSDFEELGKMFVKIVVDEDVPPFQLIYAVDDAWRWPDRMQLKVSETVCSSVFPETLCGKTIKVHDQKFDLINQSGQRKAGTASEEAKTEEGASLLQTLKKCLGKEDANSDTDTAKALIHFIQDRFKATEKKENYGLCFCSFEYFHSHIQSIDQPQNAVFFDLRHQLASTGTNERKEELTALRSDWNEKLTGYTLFGDGQFDISRLGWYLHYGLKFGKIDDNNTQNRSYIHFNNILIISSAVASQDSAPEERDAIGEYLQTQNVIWQHVKDIEQVEYLPSHFNFSPLPKNFTDGHFEAGLRIFNNSFKHAASWERKREALIKDMLLLWNRPGAAKNGHPTGTETRDNPALAFSNWVVGDEKQYRKDLYYGVHHLSDDQRAHPISIESLIGFLKHSLFVDIPTLTDCKFSDVKLPTNPGLYFLIGLANVYHALNATELKENQKPPTIKFVANNNKIILKMIISKIGVCDLREKLSLGKTDGTVGALKNAFLGNNIILAPDNQPQSAPVKNQSNTKSCNIKALKETITLDDDSICFHFNKYNQTPD